MSELDNLGEQLLEVVRAAREEVLLCAPFVKAGVIARILDATAEGVRISLVTRWRAEEVAAGVSDTSVLDQLAERGGRVFLCDRLHAKYVRADAHVLIGSANLTATALGWTAAPNLELLTSVPADLPQVAVFEHVLTAETIPATSELVAEIEKAAALLPSPPQLLVEESAVPDDNQRRDGSWLPGLREPRDLFSAYTTGIDRLSSMSARAARVDLAFLDLPPDLEKPAFNALVGTRLLQSPGVRAVDEMLGEPQRFGAVRDHLAKQLEMSREDADYTWQTLMRWLLHFLPHRYERRVYNRSEVLARVAKGIE